MKALNEIYEKTAVLKQALLELEHAIMVNFGQMATVAGTASSPMELYLVGSKEFFLLKVRQILKTEKKIEIIAPIFSTQSKRYFAESV